MTVTALDIPRKKKRRPSGAATPNGIPTSTPGRAAGDYIVAVGPLADILEPEIKRLNKIMAIPGNRANNEEVGGLYILCEWAADFLPNSTSQAVIRRVYDIREGKSRTTSTELADALLLALGKDIEREDTLATLPGGLDAARELVDIHFENTGERISIRQRHTLAKQLMAFTNGYVADSLDEDVETEEWARRVASHRLRKARERGLYPFPERYEITEAA